MIIDALNQAGLSPHAAPFWLVLFLLLAAIFFVVQVSRLAKRNTGLRSELERTRISLAGVEARAGEADGLKDALAEERAQRGRLEAEAAVNDVKLAERERAMQDQRARMETDFKATTAQMLSEAHKSFLERANETFQRYTDNASSEGAKRSKALDELLKPVSDTLVRYEKSLADLRTEQEKSRGELKGQIGALSKSAHDVRMEAQKLATALRAGPKTRGRWGEEQLRNVVEMAGMQLHVDFVEQVVHHDGEKRKQPDMVVRLPGGRVVVVDSKVSLGAYLDAVDAETDELRTKHLNRHADALWSHVKNLSGKGYAASMREALDYVVMFVPGENYYAAALEVRPQLYQDAFDRKILIATPTILIAMLKSAALNWRQEKMTEHAQTVAAMAKELYDSLRVMGGHMSGLGKALDGAVKKYNATVGGFEGRVMSRARKFAEYELPGIDTIIEPLEPLDGAPRALRDDRDLSPAASGAAEDAA